METAWLSSQFIENALRRAENDDSICVIDCSVKPATNKGDNYTSDMFRAAIEFRRCQGVKEITEKRSIIIKVAPTTIGAHKELIEQAGLFDVEMKMMTTTLKEMQMLLKDTKLGANCYFTQDRDPPLLIIEDLAPLGFRMACRQAGLDFEHCILALRGLAKFHASSVAVCEKVPKYKSSYRKGIFNRENPPEMNRFFISGMKTLAKVVKTWPELEPKYGEKLEKIADVAYDRASDSRILNNSEFNVINHGDFWVNNMLFKYDNKNKVTEHIFVDFQLCVYGTPAIDLNYFLNTSPSEEVLLNYKDNILNEYLQVLTSTMKKIGCKIVPPSMNDLKNAIRKCEPYGFLAAATILPIVLIDKKEAQNLEEIMGQDDDDFNVKAYTNELYKKTMIRRLHDWESMGLFDL